MRTFVLAPRSALLLPPQSCSSCWPHPEPSFALAEPDTEQGEPKPARRAQQDVLYVEVRKFPR